MADTREVLEAVGDLVSHKGNYTQDTANALARAGVAFLIQMAADLKTTEERVAPENVFRALRARGFRKMCDDVERDYLEKLAQIKQAKLQRLRDAGFGLSTDHVSFMKAVFVSHFKEQNSRDDDDV